MRELTHDAEHTGNRMMLVALVLVALGYEPPDRAPPGVPRFIDEGDPNKRPSPLPPEPILT